MGETAATNALDAKRLRTAYARFLTNRQVQGTSRKQQNDLKREHRRRIRRLAVLFLPLAVLMRLLRPLLLVRVGYVLKHKIGHCPMEAEAYLLERAAGLQPRNALDLFYFDYGTDGQSGNLFAEHLVRRHLRLHDWAEALAVASEWLPGAAKHRITIRFRDLHQFADVDALLANVPQQITLLPAEIDLGWDLLAEMGVPRGSTFVCFHVREAGYWSSRKEGIGDDSDFRNSHIANYEEAMLAVAERGGYAIRIGATSGTPLSVHHPHVIDYALHHRSEFMDVFLAAQCDLMVSTASGIDTISYFFHRPILFTNLSAWGWEYVGLPQPFLCTIKGFRRNGRLMTFAEVIAEGVQEFTVTSDFAKAGIALEENSADELKAAVIEMLDRIEGAFVPDADAVRRAALAKAHIGKSPRYRDWQFELPASYLQKYESLL